LGYISQNPSWLVLDFGAQIGQYSLFAASMGRQVLTVEPFYDNIVRLHKAATEEKIQNKIKLVKNALSNKRNEIKRLQPNSDNIGGQSLLQSKNKNYKKSDMANDKYLVETILLDDLVEQLPLNSDGKKYKQAILKIDIEGKY
jgi:FkbM family methyltransferase